MTTLCVAGVQWGDEGKGKIVDLLSEKMDFVVRFQGGANAGHTVVVRGEKFVFHHIPSGVFHKRPKCVIANGVVLDPAQLLSEIQSLKRRGIAVEKKLILSNRAHLVMPYHKALDRLAESNGDNLKIGTTQRGIGPCYADKVARKGLRVADLYNPSYFRERLAQLLEEKNKILRYVYGGQPLKPKPIFEEYQRYARQMKPFVTDTVELLNDAIECGKKVLFEGAQGSLLDIDFGTYPYVTSSNADACGITAGTGIPPKKVDHILGVAKAYTTRVGEGPFPTELCNHQGELLRQKGDEFGSTTGRPRRCGWFDGVASRHAIQVNGIEELVITKLDVLSGFETIQVCTSYRCDGKLTAKVPVAISQLKESKPVYKTFRGWNQPLSRIRRYADLPKETKRYLEFLESFLNVRICLISVGTDRTEAIWR